VTAAAIPFNRATFPGREFVYLAQAVTDGHVSGNGPLGKQAEAMLSRWCNDAPVLLTTSCTHALEMAAMLLNLEPGDEVIVPSFTFVSTASAFVRSGARPVFVDVCDDTLNLAPDLVEAAITARTRAIVVVHYAGVGADLVRLAAIADRHGLMLIEDNAHGLFGSRDGVALGSAGALSTLSFHETKNVTCGEGGALVLNDRSLLERAEILREKGTDRSRFLRGQVDKYTWVDVGSSYVLSDLLAGLLVGQLEHVEETQRRRLEIWDRYHAELAAACERRGIRRPTVPTGCDHTAHMYQLRLDSLDARDRFIAALAASGVSAVFHYQPLHLSVVGRSFGGFEGQCPVTERTADTLVRLPLFSGLTDHEQSRIIDAVRRFCAT
jgi:dTDP-4-amino-4,6-dideoxygalactose transaminase